MDRPSAIPSAKPSAIPSAKPSAIPSAKPMFRRGIHVLMTLNNESTVCSFNLKSRGGQFLDET